MKPATSMEPVLILLFVGILFFTGMLFVADKWYPNDGQLFQVVSGLLTAFGGAFMTRIKPKGDDPVALSSTTTTMREGQPGSTSTTTLQKGPTTEPNKETQP